MFMNMKKIAAVMCAFAVVAMMLSSCGDKEGQSSAAESSVSSSQPAQDTAPETEKPPETDEEWHDAMLRKSVVTLGDTAKLKEKIAKARNGDKVTLAYLGGSITEGFTAGSELCYAKLSCQKFAERFGKDGGGNVEYVNAGIAGTPSRLGNLRLERDVLSKEPDICFVEFAVNDGTDEDCQASYESIVRDLLEHDCAVILLFSVTADDYSAQDYMKNIGQYYGLPMISYCDALRYMFENNKMKWEDFSDDKSHPNEKGHALVAEMIDLFFAQADVTETAPREFPAAPISIMIQQGMKLLENEDIEPVSLGSWDVGSTVNYFTKGWTYEPGTGNEPLVFKFKGRFAHLVYKEVKFGQFGDLHIKVTCDGQPYDDKTVKTVTKDGFGNPQITLLGMQVDETEYTVEISMAEGSEDKKGEILAVAHN